MARLHLRGGAAAAISVPYGPTYGPGYVRNNAGPQRGGTPVSISVFDGQLGVDYVALNPSNSQATNQSVINSDSTGQVWWPAGTYTASAAYTLKSGQEHRMETGPLRTASDTAILTNSGSTINLVDVQVTNITWKGGILSGGGRGIRVGGNSAVPVDGFTIEDCELRDQASSCFGVSSGSSSVQTTGVAVRHCYFLRGGQYNCNGYGLVDSVWEYNRSAYGNNDHYGTDYRLTTGPYDEGGSKFLNCPGMIWRNNWSSYHDGSEWWDTNNEGILIEESVFDSCYQFGVFIEDNGGVTIRRCTFNDNAQTDPVGGDWSYGSYMGNLMVSSSDHVEITLCDFIRTPAVTFNYEGDIRAIHSSGRLHDTTDMWVHHNRFTRTRSGATSRGFVNVRNSAADIAYTTFNNKWDYNEYHVPSGETGAVWFYLPSGTNKTWAQWQAGGSDPYAPGSFYDPNGSLTGDA